MSVGGGSTVPQPIPPRQDYEHLEGLPELIRRIVREELRPIHLLLEELRDRSGGPAGRTG